MDNRSRVTAAGTLIAAVVSWALAPVFIRFLSGAYDPYSQAFVRYVSGAVCLTAVSWIGFRGEFVRLLRHPGMLLGIACLNTFQQCTWTMGTYDATATMAQLITKLNVVLVIVLSFFLFREERGIIRNPAYLGGTALSLVGVTAVLAKEPGSFVPVFDRAAALLLVTAVCWGIYMVWSKHAVMGIHPVPMFTVVAIYTSLGLAVSSAVLGDPGTILAAGPSVTGIAFVSGVFPIAVAHTAFNYSQKHLGAAFSNSCNLLTPLLTYVFAMIILNDAPLTKAQWMGAALLLAGTGLVTVAGQRARRIAALAAAEAPSDAHP